MKISWKTNGSAGAVEFMENRLSTGSKTDYRAWAESNGRINFKYEVVFFYNVYGPKQICQGNMATVIGIFEDHYLKKKPLPVEN